MSYKIKKSMAIMSHLSDVQEIISFGKTKDESLTNFANLRINFVKMLILDKRTELTEDELNELWRKSVERYG
jgi:hypothetical protein